MTPAAIVAWSAYGSVLLLLFAYAANGYVLLLRRRRWSPPTATSPVEWPSVTVQIPIFNERDVASRVIRAATAMTYPGRMQVQVLDDSDDDTPAIAAAAVESARRSGLDVQHLRRRDRAGFKAGALAEGLARAEGQAILILDADFVPPPDLLIRMVPLLGGDRVACVQGRWDHLNRHASDLTAAQALGIDVHFAIEQRGRAAAGWPVAFNGSVGLWWRAAIHDAGGWSSDTLTEDLDLSYRAWLRGWRTVYAAEVRCPGEIPERLAACKAQQRRWARGSIATARKLLGAIWRSGHPLGARIEATLHLTHYAVHPLILLSIVLALPLGLGTVPPQGPWAVLPVFALATGAPTAMALAAAAERGSSWRGRLRELGSLMLLGIGLCVSSSIAVVEGLAREPGSFERTPKGGGSSSYRAHAGHGLGVAEVLAAASCLALAALFVGRGLPGLSPFLVLYGAGFGRVGIATLREQPAPAARATRLAAESTHA